MKESNRGTVILLTILVLVLLAVIGVGGYFIFQMSDKIDKQTVNEGTTVDSNKDVVTDAKYTIKELEGEKYYSNTYERYYSLDDIVVPYINIDSEDAKKINQEIKEVYNEMAGHFKNNLEDAEPDQDLNMDKVCPWWISSNYEVYTNDNVLSVVITQSTGGTASTIKKYYTFNIDLETYNIIEFEDLYKIVGFTDSDIDEKVENAIENSSHYNDKPIKEYYQQSEINEWIKNSKRNYSDSVSNDSIGCFLDENGILRVVVLIDIPVVQDGAYDEILEIK